jgi:hypothetical protein
MAEHSTLTGSDLHEPKGVAAASANTVYVANGSGSGTWRKVAKADLNNTEIFPNQFTVSLTLTDISTAETLLVAVPYTSTLTRVVGVLGGAITGSDAAVTLLQNGGSTVSTITVAYTGSAKGNDTVINPASNNTFIAGDFIEITTDGASTGTALYTITLVFERTA